HSCECSQPDEKLLPGEGAKGHQDWGENPQSCRDNKESCCAGECPRHKVHTARDDQKSTSEHDRSLTNLLPGHFAHGDEERNKNPQSSDSNQHRGSAS